jgi:hypothetical protein
VRIGLFVTCLTDTLFPDTGKAAVTVLERLGHRVEFPAGQACCGQMHFNTGYRREATPMARGFVAAFGGFEAVVTPSASCAFMVREYYPALAAEAADESLARAVAQVAPRTYELSVFLADGLGVAGQRQVVPEIGGGVGGRHAGQVVADGDALVAPGRRARPASCFGPSRGGEEIDLDVPRYADPQSLAALVRRILRDGASPFAAAAPSS